MSDLRVKLKRQIEILGMVLANPRKYYAVDLEFIFNCNEITIKRDLSELRGRGINIHSVSKKGIIIEGNIHLRTTEELLNEYIFLAQLEGTQRKATESLVNLKKGQSLSLIVIIQRAIEQNKMLSIIYKKSDSSNGVLKTIAPLVLFERENSWRLLAIEKGTRKQFVVEKIETVRELDKIFDKPDKKQLSKAFELSFGAWIADKSIPVKLRFSKEWLSSGKIPHLMKDQQIAKHSDGSLIVSFNVSYLEDLARWIVARGGEVIALEPLELKHIVINFAKNSFKLHTN